MVDVLILSTYDEDGAGRFSMQVARYLQRIGYTTKIVCVKNQSGEAVSQGILDDSVLRRATYRLAQEMDRRVFRPSSAHAFIHLRGVSDRVVLKSGVWPDHCRLIICAFSSGMLSPRALETIWTRYGAPPVFFYAIDMNLYTGGCHYARECTGYEGECAHCPAVPRLLYSRVQKALAEKRVLYQKIRNHIALACSHEQAQQMRRSALFAGSDVRRLLMSVDESVFGKNESAREKVKIEYGFDGRVLLIRSSSEPRKGCDIFLEALNLLIAELPELATKLTIVAIGDHYLADRLDRQLGLKIFSLGYISSETELSRLYSAADVFVNSSIADSGPVMLAQSLMSGTPVVSNSVGLAMDLVEHSFNGYLTGSMSAEGLKNALKEFAFLGDDALVEMRSSARRRALEQISERVYLGELSRLVEEQIGAP
jgi:glycosyltransferase involved in cell wall biosynthesis